MKLKSKNEEPQIFFKDEFSYAIKNIIQNAIQHSKNLVTVEIFITFSLVYC